MRSSRLVLTAATLVLSLGAEARTQEDCGATYTVRSGDTMTAIASRCGITIDALTGANPQIADPGRLSVGWELAVPGSSAPAVAEEWARGRDAEAAAVLATGRYTVGPGDSMARIATELGVPLRALLAANPEVDPFALQPGQQLLLPGAASGEEAPEDSAAEEAAGQDAAADKIGGGAGDRPGDAVGPGAGERAAGQDAAVDEIGGRAGDRPGDAAGSAAKEEPPEEDGAGESARQGTSPDGAAGAESGTAAGEDAAASGAAGENAAESGTAGGENAAESGTAAGEDAAPSGAAGEDALSAARPAEEEPGRLVLEGRIRKGGECPVLTTSTGRTYSLVSQDYGFIPGDYVSLEGEPVEMSLCTEGQTVRVTSMKHKQVPGGG